MRLAVWIVCWVGSLVGVVVVVLVVVVGLLFEGEEEEEAGGTISGNCFR